MKYRTVEDCVEAVCNKGCKAVRADMAMLQQGLCTPELEGLSEADRRRVMQELQAIMDVYGEGCKVY